MWILVPEPAPRTESSGSISPRRRTLTASTRSWSSRGTGRPTWNQFSANVVNGLHARGLDGLRLAVQLRRQPGQGGEGGAAAVARGADLPGARRGGPVRGQVSAGLVFHVEACARWSGAGLSTRARQLPVRRLTTLRCPSPSSWGPAALSTNIPQALLEGHRDHGRHRLHPHLGVEPDLPAADRPAGAGLQQPEGRPDQSASGRWRCRTASRRQLVVLAVGGEAAVGGPWASPSPRPPLGRTRANPFLHLGSKGDFVAWAQQLLAGGGYTVPVSGYFQSSTQAGRLRIPARPWAAADRQPRRADLGGRCWRTSRFRFAGSAAAEPFRRRRPGAGCWRRRSRAQLPAVRNENPVALQARLAGRPCT